ncbi:unnamed protein product [Ceratitis capitata]|uniref:(Mediterranean fruit fly) hypothetical protein n=1 Tax=Ceratitis capitata TaxID=7213 RepID=A0A811UY44_CERCA|nr:unnamed protein product [Ceratitis capitata]
MVCNVGDCGNCSMELEGDTGSQSLLMASAFVMMTAEALSIFAYWLDETSQNGSERDDDLEVDPTYLVDLDDGIQNNVAYNQSYVQSTSAHLQEDVGMSQIDLQYDCEMTSFTIGMC